MKTIYVVTSGEYSDYRICAVFDNKDLAEKFSGNFMEADIEEYQLNPHEDEIKNNRKPFIVIMDKDGNTPKVEPPLSYYGFDRKIMYNHKGNLQSHVFANDEKHAIKIVNERRLQILAANTWGKNI